MKNDWVMHEHVLDLGAWSRLHRGGHFCRQVHSVLFLDLVFWDSGFGSAKLLRRSELPLHMFVTRNGIYPHVAPIYSK